MKIITRLLVSVRCAIHFPSNISPLNEIVNGENPLINGFVI